jgi:hypothetical protein
VLFQGLPTGHPPQRDKLIELAQEISFGYKNVLLDLSKTRSIFTPSNKSLSITLYSTLKFLGLGLQFRAANQEPPEKHAWRELYQVYIFAVKRKLNHKSVQIQQLNGQQKTCTPQSCFRQTILHALFDPYRLSQAQSWALYFLLDDPEIKCDLSPLDDQNIHSDSYLVNLDEDHRPQPSSLVANLLHAEMQLVIDASQVVRALNQDSRHVAHRLCAVLPPRASERALPIAKYTLKEVTHNLLRRRINRSKRTPCQGSVALYLGLSAAHNALREGDDLGSISATDQELDWTGQARRTPDQHQVMGLTGQIINATQGGMAVRIHTNCDQISAGLPLYFYSEHATGQEDIPNNAISLVRWAMRTGPEVWTLGLQHIAYKVLAVRIRATDGRNLDTYWQSGLYLDNQAGIQSVLSPPNMFHSDRVFEVEFPTDVIDLRATLCYDNTSHFDWFKVMSLEN